MAVDGLQTRILLLGCFPFAETPWISLDLSSFTHPPFCALDGPPLPLFSFRFITM